MRAETQGAAVPGAPETSSQTSASALSSAIGYEFEPWLDRLPKLNDKTATINRKGLPINDRSPSPTSPSVDGAMAGGDHRDVVRVGIVCAELIAPFRRLGDVALSARKIRAVVADPNTSGHAPPRRRFLNGLVTAPGEIENSPSVRDQRLGELPRRVVVANLQAVGDRRRDLGADRPRRQAYPPNYGEQCDCPRHHEATRRSESSVHRGPLDWRANGSKAKLVANRGD